MKRFLSLCVLAGLLTGCAVPISGPIVSTQPISITANRFWSGQAYQTDTRSTWTASGYIVPGEDSLMSYPDLGCTGKWTFQGHNLDGSLKYHEQIFRDPKNRCIKHVDLTIKAVDANTVEYKTFDSRGKQNSSATLRAQAVPVPAGLSGSWTGSAKNAAGQPTEVQLRLNANERSYFHQFASACTYELFMAEYTERSIALDTTSGMSDKGAACDGAGMLMFSLKADGTLMMRSFSGARLINEVYLKRM